MHVSPSSPWVTQHFYGFSAESRKQDSPSIIKLFPCIFELEFVAGSTTTEQLHIYSHRYLSQLGVDKAAQAFSTAKERKDGVWCHQTCPAPETGASAHTDHPCVMYQQ